MSLGWLDYGWRMYDPAAPHFTSIDPMAAFVPGISPYHYCYNNPINFIDPDGMWVKGAGFWNNISKSDERNEAEMAAASLRDGGEVSNVTVEKNGKGSWRVSWTEKNSENSTGDNAVYLPVFGFCDYNKSENNTPNAAEVAFTELDNLVVKLGDSYKESKAGKIMAKGDEIAPQVAQVGVKIFPPTAVIDAGKTIITGKDINETVQEGTLNRYVLPTLTLAAPTLKGLNMAGTISLSDDALKGINTIENINTGVSGLQETKKQINKE